MNHGNLLIDGHRGQQPFDSGRITREIWCR
jgi:hypothetical protein